MAQESLNKCVCPSGKHPLQNLKFLTNIHQFESHESKILQILYNFGETLKEIDSTSSPLPGLKIYNSTLLDSFRFFSGHFKN